MAQLIPRKPVPALDVPLVGSGRFVLAESKPALFTMLIYYRGYHCPLCRSQLTDLKSRLSALSELGVEAIGISMDSEERARKSVEEWELGGLRIAHSLTEEAARAFGLYISGAISDKEPDRFSEPGLFLVNPDGTLYFTSVQSSPFTRPPLAELMQGIGYVKQAGYPARGELAD
jgi:peroxiredoxin